MKEEVVFLLVSATSETLKYRFSIVPPHERKFTIIMKKDQHDDFIENFKNDKVIAENILKWADVFGKTGPLSIELTINDIQFITKETLDNSKMCDLIMDEDDPAPNPFKSIIGFLDNRQVLKTYDKPQYSLLGLIMGTEYCLITRSLDQETVRKALPLILRNDFIPREITSVLPNPESMDISTIINFIDDHHEPFKKEYAILLPDTIDIDTCMKLRKLTMYRNLNIYIIFNNGKIGKMLSTERMDKSFEIIMLV